MSLNKERLQASIPFLILFLCISWVGYQFLQTSSTIAAHKNALIQSRALMHENKTVMSKLGKIRHEAVLSDPQIRTAELQKTLVTTFSFIEHLSAPLSESNVDPALLDRIKMQIAKTQRMLEQTTLAAEQNPIHETFSELYEELLPIEKNVEEMHQTAYTRLASFNPPSFTLIFLELFLVLLLVVLLENLFAGMIREKLVTLRNALLTLNQNRLDLKTSIELDLKGGMGNLYPLPKIAHLFNCFLESHQTVLQKIRSSAENCEHANSLIRNCHKEIYEGTRVQANATDETSSSTYQMNATLNEIVSNVDGLTSSAEESSHSIKRMGHSINQISKSSEELFELVDSSSSSINEMVVSISHIRENQNSLSSSVENTTSSASEINASIKEVSQMAKESAELSQKTTTETSELGVKAVVKTIEGMHRIRKTVEDTDARIKNLHHRSEEIGEILVVIDEVAEQTNLLALNASIIAAQAGEHGKGFAVVADEIKSLAEKTAASIEQIENAISSVQTETESVSSSIQQSVKQVQEGVSLSEETKRVLERILKQSKQSSDMSWKIEKAANEQVQSMDHINTEIQNINNMVHQIDAAVGEQDKGGKIIREMVEKLKNFSLQLRSNMSDETKASNNISTEIESFFSNLQEINRAIQEHRKGSEQIIRSIERIRVITEANLNMTDDLNMTIGSLSIHNDELQKEVQKFHINTDEVPLRLGIVPLESEIKMLLKFTPLARYLEQKIHRKVEIRVGHDLEDTVRELGTGKTDIAYLTPSTFIEASKRFGCKVILKAMRNNSPFYHSVIAVQDSSPTRTVADLKGKRFGFGDKNSTSSYHVPKAMLLKEKISLNDLGAYKFLGNHEAVAWAIVNGDVDAGALLEPIAKKFIDKGLKILKISADIPEFNFCVGKDIELELKEKLIQALLALNEERPEDRTILKNIEYEYNGFTSANEMDYNGIKEIMILSQNDVA